MKKRIVSLALALLFCLGLAAPAGLVIPAEAAVSASDAQAYLDILDRTDPDDSYLIDFDGDGRDELLTVRTANGTYGLEAYYSIYKGSTALVTDADMKLTFGTGCTEAFVCTKNGEAGIGFCYGLGGGYHMDYFIVQNGQWMLETSVEAYFDTDWTDYEQAVAAHQFQFSIHPSENPTHGNVRSELEAIVQAEALKNATPEEILAQIPYYGDRSKCRLTSEQAAAFVQTIENLDIHEGMHSEDVDMLYSDIRVALCDVEGNGVPALLLYYRLVSPYPDSEWMGELNVIVYLWENNQIREITELPSIFRTYGTAASEVFTSFGKNRFGGYGWSAWWRQMAGAEQYNDVYYFKNGELQHSLCDEIVDLDTYMVTVSLDGVVKGVFSETNSNETSALVQELIEQAGGPIAQDQEETDTIPVASAKSALRAYADAKKFPTYTYTQTESGDVHYSDVAAAVSGQGAIQAIYKLLEDAYYVLLENSGVYSGALVRGLRENGSPVWKVTQTDAEPAAEDALGRLVNRLATVTNLNLDYGKLRGSPSLAELTDYLRETLKNIDGLAPNDPAKSDLAAFLDSAVTALASGSVSGKNNRLTLGDKELSDLATTAQSTLGTLNRLLQDNGVELNKTLQPVIRVLWSDIDKDKAYQLTLNRDTVKSLTGCDLQVLLGDAQTYLRITPEGLSTLISDLESLSIQVLQEDPGVYDIRFLDGDGQVVERLSQPVTIGLSAPNEMSTIIATYTGGSDNWGGQYDPTSGTLSFETIFSGRYEVLENSVAIDDISELSEESQSAIRFMVSKGYFTVEDGLFRPGDPLDRYKFTEALVGMFFALDRSLTTRFTDVPADSPYYAYVASAQARDIVKGFGDSIFSGESNITREQVFALAARTLIDQKGYSLPADAGSYLGGYSDRDAISGWATDLVALAVREGVASRGASLRPQADITREQAAVVLYRLFQLLYEVSPVALDMPEAAAGGSVVPIVLGVAGGTAGVAAIALGTVLVLKKKGKLKRAKTAPTEGEM